MRTIVSFDSDPDPAPPSGDFSVPGPDGESALYHAMDGGANVLIYRRDWMPESGGGYSPAKLIATIPK